MRLMREQLTDVREYLLILAAEAAIAGVHHVESDEPRRWRDAVTAADISKLAQEASRFCAIVAAELDDAIDRDPGTWLANPIVAGLFTSTNDVQRRLREVQHG